MSLQQKNILKNPCVLSIGGFEKQRRCARQVPALLNATAQGQSLATGYECVTLYFTLSLYYLYTSLYFTVLTQLYFIASLVYCNVLSVFRGMVHSFHCITCMVQFSLYHLYVVLLNYFAVLLVCCTVIHCISLYRFYVALYSLYFPVSPICCNALHCITCMLHYIHGITCTLHCIHVISIYHLYITL